MDFYVKIEGSPHSAQIFFDPDQVTDELGERIHADVRVTPDFKSGDDEGFLDQWVCELEHRVSVAGATALRASAELAGETYAQHHDRIVRSVSDMVIGLNHLANGTGPWQPPRIES